MSKKKTITLSKLYSEILSQQKKHNALILDKLDYTQSIDKEKENEKSGQKGIILNSEYYSNKLTENKKKINSTTENLDKLNNALDARLSIVQENIKALSELVQGIEQKNQSSSLNSTEQKQLETWKSNLKNFNDEFKEYNNLIGNVKEEVLTIEKKAIEKEKKEKAKEQVKVAKEKKVKVEKEAKQEREQVETYENHRDKLLSAITEISKDPKNIDQIFDNILGDKKLKTTISALKFAANNAGSLGKIVTSVPFLNKEAKLLTNIINGNEKLDPKNPAFFLKLIRDQKTQDFLNNNGANINNLVSTIAPKLVNIAVNNFMNLPKMEKELLTSQKKLEELNAGSRPFGMVTSKEIESLENKIKSIDDRKKIILIVTQNITPIIQNITHEFLVQNPKEFGEIIQLGTDFALEKDELKKNKITTNLINKLDIAKLLSHESMRALLEPAKNSELANVVNVMIANNPSYKKIIRQYDITDEMVNDSVGVISQIGSNIIQNPSFKELIDVVGKVATSNTKFAMREAQSVKEVENFVKEDDANKAKILQNLTESFMKPEMLDILKGPTLDLLNKHKEIIGNIVVNNLPKATDSMVKNTALAVNAIKNDGLDKKEINNIVLSAPAKFLQKVNPTFYKEIVKSAIPLVSDVIKSLPNKNIQEIYSRVRILGKPETKEMKGEAIDLLRELKSDMRRDLIQTAISVISDEKVAKSISENFSNLVATKEFQDGAVQILDNAKEYVPAVANLDIKKDTLKSVTKVVSNLGSAVLSKTQDIVGLYNEVSKINSLKDKELDKVFKEKSVKIVDHINNIIDDNLVSKLSNDLPKFLNENKKEIINVVGNFLDHNPEIEKRAQSIGIDKKFAKELTAAGASLVQGAIPEVIGLAKCLASDKDGMVNLFENIRNANKAEGKISKVKSGISIAQSLYSIIAKNDQLKSILDNIPNNLNEKLEEKNEAGVTLGATIDKLLQKTTIGKNITKKGTDMLKILANQLPKVSEVLQDLNDKKVAKAAFSAVKIMFNPETMSFAASLIGDASRYVYQSRLVSDKTRHKECNFEMNGMLNNISNNAENLRPDGKLLNLGKMLEQKISEDQKNSLQYSLKNHDMRGLDFGTSEKSLKLEKFKIDNFNFKNTNFKGNISFEGSKILNCSFDKAKFDKDAKLNFKGATIDAKTLESLLPAIRKHNSQKGLESDKKIILEGVKIIGDVSKVNMKDAPIINAEFIETKVNKEKNNDLQNQIKSISNKIENFVINDNNVINTNVKSKNMHKSEGKSK